MLSLRVKFAFLVFRWLRSWRSKQKWMASTSQKCQFLWICVVDQKSVFKLFLVGGPWNRVLSNLMPRLAYVRIPCWFMVIYFLSHWQHSVICLHTCVRYYWELYSHPFLWMRLQHIEFDSLVLNKHKAVKSCAEWIQRKLLLNTVKTLQIYSDTSDIMSGTNKCLVGFMYQIHWFLGDSPVQPNSIQ